MGFDPIGAIGKLFTTILYVIFFPIIFPLNFRKPRIIAQPIFSIILLLAMLAIDIIYTAPGTDDPDDYETNKFAYILLWIYLIMTFIYVESAAEAYQLSGETRAIRRSRSRTTACIMTIIILAFMFSLFILIDRYDSGHKGLWEIGGFLDLLGFLLDLTVVMEHRAAAAAAARPLPLVSSLPPSTYNTGTFQKKQSELEVVEKAEEIPLMDPVASEWNAAQPAYDYGEPTPYGTML
eukprot:gnl/Dysnectes_brevis/3889_a5031_983.p1 GENE.gnl/Dysnectes_brevis/3889_a5031_983~~gnl/Dysnectes_brevis/3889_a5031_983.p1  ORF type:complete len:236 (+),score=29.35 gnl/Dysnectes_brevis/3889_a5031_983:30-737(+)